MKWTIRRLSLLLALLLGGSVLAGPAGAAADSSVYYADTEQHWAREDIRAVVAQGLMDPVTRYYFEPDTPVTRATLVAALYRLAGTPEMPAPSQIGARGSFDDVLVDSAAYQSVEWAVSQGIVNGYNGQFRPDDALTREELAVIFWRFCHWQGYDGAAARHLSDYSDGAQVSDWAQKAVNWALEQGLLAGMGDGTLAPGGAATRAQLAAILLRYQAAEDQFRPAPDAEITDPVPDRVTE